MVKKVAWWPFVRNFFAEFDTLILRRCRLRRQAFTLE